MTHSTPPGLEPIAQGIYLGKNAESGPASGQSKAPTVIIIFGWMAAKLEHLSKYCQGYKELYPEARQLLIRSEMSMMWNTTSKQFALIAPAAEALEALGAVSSKPNSNLSSEAPPATQHRILIHAFSNGGCAQLIYLSLYLARNGYTSHPWPSALVIDSAPGYGGFKASKAAWVDSVADPVPRYLLLATVVLYHLIFYTLLPVFGYHPMLEKLYEELKNPSLLPWMNSETPRLYIFSKQDKVVPWEKVWAHGEDSRKLGVAWVDREVFDGTGHVAHAREDPARYWNAVQRTWNAVG